MNNPLFKVGMVFDSTASLKRAITEAAIKEGKEVKFSKNDLIRVRAKCGDDCGFLLFTSKTKTDKSLRIKN